MTSSTAVGARRSADWVTEHVRLATSGAPAAWQEIVAEFAGMLRAVAREHRLSEADAADIAQTVWLRLAENLHRLENPSRVGAWLSTTARRECLRALRSTTRELPVAEPPEPRHDDLPPVGAELLGADRDTALWSAFRRLPARDQALLRMLVADPQPSYQEIGSALGMPVGSIGPTRGRALERLRAELKRSDDLEMLAA